MQFTNLVFIFAFLPIVIAIYYVLHGNRTIQNFFLFVVSIFFYAWGEPKFSAVLLCSIVINWLLAFLIGQFRKSKLFCRILLFLAVILNIGLLFVYKYLDFAIVQINRFLPYDIPLRYIVLPVGISFFTFQALSYVIDVYRGEECQRNPVNVGLYISFFPQLIAGPIVRYGSIKDQIANRRESFNLFKNGSLRFMQGFCKKILIANSMAIIADKAYSLLSQSELTVSFAWLGAIAYTFQIYYDFSGYSDMAIGLGKMFGFEFEENFNYPYMASSITDFWRRWHISLSSWFRDYVYIPLGGNRCSKRRNIFNLLVVWLLTGIWHGANWTFIIWGFLYFSLLIIEKETPFKKFLNGAFGHIYTFVMVCLLWVIFRADNIHVAADFLHVMFAGKQIYSGLTWVYIKENMVYLISAILLSVDVIPRIKHSAVNGALGFLLLVLFFVAIIYIVNGVYNPFIYFNF